MIFGCWVYPTRFLFAYLCFGFWSICWWGLALWVWLYFCLVLCFEFLDVLCGALGLFEFQLSGFAAHRIVFLLWLEVFGVFAA